MNVVATGVAATNDFIAGRYKSGSARIGVGLIAGAAAFVPFVGWGLSIGIGIVDAVWGDEFYNWLEN